MTEMICPYCNLVQEIIIKEKWYGYSFIETHKCLCCKNTYKFRVNAKITITPFKVPCWNGEKHEWEVTQLGENGHFSIECKHCNMQKFLKQVKE